MRWRRFALSSIAVVALAAAVTARAADIPPPPAEHDLQRPAGVAPGAAAAREGATFHPSAGPGPRSAPVPVPRSPADRPDDGTPPGQQERGVDIAAVGEILRQRLAQAAEAGIVVYRDGVTQEEAAGAQLADAPLAHQAAVAGLPKIVDLPPEPVPDDPDPAPAARAVPAGATMVSKDEPHSPGGPRPPGVADWRAATGVPGRGAGAVPAVNAPRRGDGAPDGEAGERPAQPAGTAARQSARPPIARPPAAGGVAEADAGDPATPTGGQAGTGDAGKLAGPTSGGAATTAPVSCLPDSALALPYATGSGVVGAAEARRPALLGEFDRPDGVAVETAARMYLTAGLGVEAAALVMAFAPESPAAAVITTLGALVDERAPGAAGPLEAPGCGGLHGLWRAYALALAGDVEGAVREAGERPDALGRLPLARRAPIALRLASAALESGGADRAAWFAAMAARGGGDDDALARELALLDARMRLRTGRGAEAVDILAGLLRSRGETAREAALLLAGLDPALALRDPEALRIAADLLGAEALMERGTPRGVDAIRAEALIVASLEGNEAALDLLSHALARGLIASEDYVASVAALDPAPANARGGTALAVLHAEEPGLFDQALRDGRFRRSLALSYARIGAPMLGRAVLAPGDLDVAGFRASLAEAAAPYRDAEVDAWLGPEPGRDAEIPRAAADAAMTDAAPAGQAVPAGAAETGPARLDSLASRASNLLAATADDIERIRRTLEDG